MSTPFIEPTGSIATILQYSTDLTGSLYMTILLITIVLFAFALFTKLPIEITIPVLLPIFLVSMAYSSEFLAVGGMFLIYLAVVLSKQFWLNR